MLDAFLQCPRKFKTQYLDEGPREEQKSLDLRFGSAMHLALKTELEGDDGHELFQMYWDTVATERLESTRYSWDDYKEMALDTFLPNFKRLHLKHIKDPVMEETLTMPVLGAHTLQGTYDCVATIDGKLTMIDWKTSAREYPQSKIYRNPQLWLYCKLYQYKYGKMPQQVMYKVFIKQEKRIQTLKCDVTQERFDSQIQNCEKIMSDIISKIDSGNWYSNYNNCFCSTPNACFK